MKLLDSFNSWYRWGHWLDTPQGICVLLSIPICWLGALASFLWPGEGRPMFLSESGLLIVTPLLAFLVFVRFGQIGDRQFSSSWFVTLIVLSTIVTPFCMPYFRN
jgi:hypothetical protein